MIMCAGWCEGKDPLVRMRKDDPAAAREARSRTAWRDSSGRLGGVPKRNGTGRGVSASIRGMLQPAVSGATNHEEMVRIAPAPRARWISSSVEDG